MTAVVIGIDAIHDGIGEAKHSGQGDMVELPEAQLADEVQHVPYANEWARRTVAREGARAGFSEDEIEIVRRLTGA